MGCAPCQKKRQDFLSNHTFLIENESTHKFLTKRHHWTANPEVAMRFRTTLMAVQYAIAKKMSGYKISEHIPKVVK